VKSSSDIVIPTHLGEFVEDAGASPQMAGGEIVKPRPWGPFVETAAQPAPLRNFVILFKETRQGVTVRGTGLRYIESRSATDRGSYAVVHGEGERATIVALVPAPEVFGVFEGSAASLFPVAPAT
jgi:hypothetical protein